MTIIVKDRVRETSTTTGTGTLTLAGAVTGFQAFSVLGTGAQTYYCIVEPSSGAWEVGVGTVGTGTLARDTVLDSSSAGAKVNFAAPSKDVFCTYPAERSVSQADVGTDPNQVPLNQYLGGMAYQNPESVVISPQASVTPTELGDTVFQLTNNTTLTVKVKGLDGTVRSVALTLA